ncbi:hypothetical protein [Cohnella sp. JJ-181]|uniref:hypothetical protein n=1 Tax=Cohnella rhizoplanae TaxID=2974897 RepID=UPI0023312121|nr:hypothetical protein [Cohnella sp. JJ-181]
MRLKRLLILLLLSLLVSACSSKPEINRDELHQSSGVIKTVVKARGKLITDLNEKYFLSLADFSPTGEDFEEYNKKYQDSSDYHAIAITDNTRIYMLDGDKKRTLSVEELEKNRDKKVQFWLFIYGSVLEAMEIDVIS